MMIIKKYYYYYYYYYYHYENTPIQIYWKFYNPKKGNFQLKNANIFLISAQNIDCGYSLEPPRRGGSNEYPQSMFWAEIRKIMYTPVNPSFIIQKWGLWGSKLYRHVFVMQRIWNLKAMTGTHDSFQVMSGVYKTNMQALFTYPLRCAANKDSDLPAHPRIMIESSLSPWRIYASSTIQNASNKDSDRLCKSTGWSESSLCAYV